VEVPAPVRLAGQDLVSHVADKAFVQTQARLVQQDLPLQRAAAICNGPSEAAGALTAHLRKHLSFRDIYIYIYIRICSQELVEFPVGDGFHSKET